MNLFKDILPSLLQARTPLLQYEDEFEQHYPPYQVNRALSYHKDCIFFANEMNASSHLTKEMQHDFYFFALRKYKRPFTGKWVKKEEKNAKDIEAIMEVLQCSRQKAEMVLPLLSDEVKVKLHEEFNQGGQ